METADQVAKITELINLYKYEAPCQEEKTQLPTKQYYVKKIYPPEVGPDGKTLINRGPWTADEKQTYLYLCEKYREDCNLNRTKDLFKDLIATIPTRNLTQIRGYHTMHNPYPGPIIHKEKRIRKPKEEMKKFRTLYQKNKRKFLERQQKRLEKLPQLILEGDNVTSNHIQLLEFLSENGKKMFIHVYVNPGVEVKTEVKEEEPKVDEEPNFQQGKSKQPKNNEKGDQQLTLSCQLRVEEKNSNQITDLEDNHVKYSFQEFINKLKNQNILTTNKEIEYIQIEDDNPILNHSKQSIKSYRDILQKPVVDMVKKRNQTEIFQIQKYQKKFEEQDQKQREDKLLNPSNSKQMAVLQQITAPTKILGNSNDDVKEEEELGPNKEQTQILLEQPNSIKYSQLIAQLENNKPPHNPNSVEKNLFQPDEPEPKSEDNSAQIIQIQSNVAEEGKNQLLNLPNNEQEISNNQVGTFQQLINFSLLQQANILPSPPTMNNQVSPKKNTNNLINSQQVAQLAPEKKAVQIPAKTDNQNNQEKPNQGQKQKKIKGSQNQKNQIASEVIKKVHKNPEIVEKPKQSIIKLKVDEQPESSNDYQKVYEPQMPGLNYSQPYYQQFPENPYYNYQQQWSPQMQFYPNPMMQMHPYMYPMPPVMPLMSPYAPIPSPIIQPNQNHPFTFKPGEQMEHQLKESATQNNLANEQTKVEMMYVYHEVPCGFDQYKFFEFSPQSFEPIPQGSILDHALKQ